MSVFRIDILNAAGVVQGDGAIITATSLNTVESLDKVGEATFSFPISDERGAFITNGSRFDMWASRGGVMKFLGRFISSRETISPDGLTRTIRCYSILRELGWQTAMFRREYTNQAVDLVVDDLVTIASGWTTLVDAGIGNTTLTIEGGSVHAAVDVLRDRWDQHFRLHNPDAATKRLDFGAFGTDSGIRIIHAKGQVTGEIAPSPEIATISDGGITVEEDSESVWNSIIALGAGQGTAQLTMEQATLGTYTLQSALNPDGSLFYYIQDATSVATYDERWKILSLPQIRPISNSDADLANGADALKLTAESFIARHIDKKRTLSVEVVGLRTDLKVGQTVRLTYRGVAKTRDGGDYVYLDEDADYYVMDIATDRTISDSEYSVKTRITISTVADRRTSDTDIMIDVINDISALKLHIAPGPARPTIGPYTRDMDSTHSAKLTISVGPETTTLNYAKLKFRTMPFRTLASDVASGGGATSSGGGSHDHEMFAFAAAQTAVNCDRRYSCKTAGGGLMEVIFGKAAASSDQNLHTEETAADHTHATPSHAHTLNYGINDDTVHPQTISVAINGIDRTGALGGPWALSNAPVDIEVDIETYLTNAAGGLRQDHLVEFTCTTGQGTIEFEVPMLCIIQAIAVS